MTGLKIKTIRLWALHAIFVAIPNSKTAHLDIRYATTQNFTHKNVYGAYKQCRLHQYAFERFKKAQTQLKKEHPGWKFRIFDCLRPRKVQFVFWDIVKDTPHQKYVADPHKGSVHNYGLAMDLSLEDAQGKELDMGTPYDSFQELAQPQLEEQFLKEGKLTPVQHANRLILRKLMTDAGFKQLPHEWWHYDSLSREEASAQGFKMVD